MEGRDEKGKRKEVGKRRRNRRKVKGEE